MESLLAEGIDLAILGMGTVFVFLTLLVFATSVMSRLILIFQPPQQVATPEAVNPQLVAAITAAVQQYRSDRGLS